MKLNCKHEPQRAPASISPTEWMQIEWNRDGDQAAENVCKDSNLLLCSLAKMTEFIVDGATGKCHLH